MLACHPVRSDNTESIITSENVAFTNVGAPLGDVTPATSIRENAPGSPASYPVVHLDKNIAGQMDAVEAQKKQPTAREIAAAKAARVRLGFENADPLDAMEPEVVRLPVGLPEPEIVAAVDYTPAAQVCPHSDPCAAAEGLEASLSTGVWTDSCLALCVTQQLALHHADLLRPLLPTVVPLMLNHIRNLRSQLTKLAILCMGDVLAVYQSSMLPLLNGCGSAKPLQSVICQLLLKAVSNEKKFVTEAATSTLDVFVSVMNPVEVLDILLPYTEHKNPKVRGASAELLVPSFRRYCNSVSNPAEVMKYSASGLLSRCVALLSDNTPKARSAARACACLIKACVEESEGQVIAPKSDGTSGIEETSKTNSETVEAESLSPWQTYCVQNLSSAHVLAIAKL